MYEGMNFGGFFFGARVARYVARSFCFGRASLAVMSITRGRQKCK